MVVLPVIAMVTRPLLSTLATAVSLEVYVSAPVPDPPVAALVKAGSPRRLVTVVGANTRGSCVPWATVTCTVRKVVAGGDALSVTV